jgi:hypothetical protein
VVWKVDFFLLLCCLFRTHGSQTLDKSKRIQRNLGVINCYILTNYVDFDFFGCGSQFFLCCKLPSDISRSQLWMRSGKSTGYNYLATIVNQATASFDPWLEYWSLIWWEIALLDFRCHSSFSV